MRKNSKIHIPVSTELKEKLEKRAEACGLSLAGYCSLVLSKAKPQIISEEEPD